MSSLDIEHLSTALRAAAPQIAPVDDTCRFASVALLLHQPRGASSPDLLFIERARHEHDPWSGHMAFPGGMREPHDEGPESTAARETFEEIGVVSGPAIARLDDYDARSGRRKFHLVVSPFVFRLDEKPKLTLNHEVADAVWIPLETILHPSSSHRHTPPSAADHVSMPAIRHDRFVVWGMTLQILESFLAKVGAALPR